MAVPGGNSPVWINGLAALAIMVAFSTPIHSQPKPNADRIQPLHAETQEVLLDFVARDKHEKLITDLRPDEVQIYEGGVLQHLNSFRYRTGNLEAESARKKGNAYDPLRELNLVSIVFDGMSAESRRRATEYALDFLNEGIGPNTWTGVFTLNYRLSVIQPYTKELSLLRAAVRRAGTDQYQTFAKDNVQLLKRMNSLQAGTNSATAWQYQPVSPGSAEEQGPATGIGKEAAKVLLAIQKALLRGLYQQAAGRSIDGLRTLVRSQALLPGRKTVLYVCEGLVIPPEQPELLRSVVSEANQANVSFYTLDARGLQMINNDRAARLATSAMDDDPSSGGNDIPLSLRTDPQANARELAAATGGFAMDNSNDLRGPLQRVMEDVRAHYEVTYTPESQTLDGRFRSIDVKVLRPGLRVQSRKGYYAVPLLNGEPLTVYEMAALRALNARPAPHAFDLHFSALDLGRTPEGVQYAMTFSVPTNAVRFERDVSIDRLRLRVACLALVKQISTSGVENGGAPIETVVAKVSKDVPYSIPAKQQAEFEAGTITVTIPLVLPTGRYHVEAALIDVQASTASVKRISLMVGESLQQSSFAVSDFVWVRSVHPHASSEAFDDTNPLDTTYGLITPNLTGSFSARQLPTFFFRIFGVSKPVTARMLISKNSTLVRNIALTLPPPTAPGTIAFLGQIPVRGLEPGQYEVELAIQSGGLETSRLTELVFFGSEGNPSLTR